MATYYDTLNIPRTATPEEIRTAWRALAQKHHPDKFVGRPETERAAAEKLFQSMSEAYTVLSDVKNRAEYDDSLPRAQPSPQPGPTAQRNWGWGPTPAQTAAQQERERPQYRASPTPPPPVALRGDHVEVVLRLDFLSAAAGGRQSVQVQRHTYCSSCRGSGIGDHAIRCPACEGGGYVMGLVVCRACNGTGSRATCVRCGGARRVPVVTSVDVTVPPGVPDGGQILVPGLGDEGDPAGDLIVRVRVQPHPVFSREGLHVLVRHSIPYTLAVLGGTSTVPTMTGTTRLTVPPGTPSGKVLTIPALGIRGAKTTGDQLVYVHIEVPQSPTGPELAAIRRLARAQGVTLPVEPRPPKGAESKKASPDS